MNRYGWIECRYDDIVSFISTLLKERDEEWRKAIGKEETKDPSHISNQAYPYLREKQIYRNELRKEILKEMEE